MNEKDLKKIKELIGNTLSLLDVPGDSLEVDEDEGTVVVNISLPEEQSGVFIGHRGETIASLRLLLALIISRRLDNWCPVRVNVGDYLERREEALLKKADEAADRAVKTGQEIIIPNLNSFERRIIHVYLENHEFVMTESRGKEPYRQLVVVPKLA